MRSKATILLWKEIHEIAQKVCEEYGLSYGKIVPETRKSVRHYGECRACPRCSHAEHIDPSKCNEKIISLSIHQLNRPHVPLARSTIIKYLAHELAHLKVWEHGPAHRKLQEDILNYIKELGYRIK